MRPIICSARFSKELRSQFKTIKMSLKTDLFPSFETNSFVELYYNLSANTYSSLIPKNAVLLNVPNRNNGNPLPFRFAALINKNLPDTLFVESSSYFLPVKNNSTSLSAKNSLTYKARTENPISFECVASGYDLAKLKQTITGRPVIILEDWASTGESCINFGKTLKLSGILANNITALITNDRNYPTHNALNKLVDTLKKNTSMCPKRLQYLVYGNFHDYLNQKIQRFSLELSRSKNHSSFIPLLEQNVEFYKKQNYTSDERIYKNISKGQNNNRASQLLA